MITCKATKNSPQVKFFRSDYFSYFCVLHNSILREKVCRNLSFYATPVIVKYKSKNVMVSTGERTPQRFRDACFVRMYLRTVCARRRKKKRGRLCHNTQWNTVNAVFLLSAICFLLRTICQIYLFILFLFVVFNLCLLELFG